MVVPYLAFGWRYLLPTPRAKQVSVYLDHVAHLAWSQAPTKP